MLASKQAGFFFFSHLLRYWSIRSHSPLLRIARIRARHVPLQGCFGAVLQAWWESEAKSKKKSRVVRRRFQARWVKVGRLATLYASFHPVIVPCILATTPI